MGEEPHCTANGEGNAAARAELRFGAERNQTQRSYLLQGCPGFSLLTGHCSSCSLLAICSLCQQNTQALHITALLGNPKLLWGHSTIDLGPGRPPGQLVELQAGVWADRRNQVGSCDCHPRDPSMCLRTAEVRDGYEGQLRAPLDLLILQLCPDMRFTWNGTVHRVHWCWLPLWTGEDPSMCLRTAEMPEIPLPWL